MKSYTNLKSVEVGIDPLLLKCPVGSGCDNLHISSVCEGKTEDMYADDTVEINMWCECGYRATLVLYTHKGSTYMGWADIELDDSDEPEPPPETVDPPDVEDLESRQMPTPDP